MLFAEIGHFALLSAFAIALLQIIFPFIGIVKNQPQLQQLAPSMAVAQAVAMLVSFIGLMASFYHNDFSLSYVANHSNSLMPWFYKLSATWGGHEGSLLLWVCILALWCACVAVFSGALPLIMRARVLVVLALIQSLMLALVIFTSSPFTRTLPFLPVDGAELNPLLQDIGLIFHPPLLYMGYVGLAVPFAFAMAALWAGRLDAAWTRWSRPWALSAWAFLTLGITLGSWWAYYELGWGGWWFWDPVENASFMPWLACTALLHSLAVTEKRGVFKAWSIMLAILAFALSLLGTFLVRSGVLTSVHSFAADPTRGLFILSILGIIIGGGLLLYALRGWQLSAESRYTLRSRETLLVINNIIILVATLVVLLGTLYPILADAFKLGQVSVGAPYFNALFVPLTWLLLLFLAIAPITRWKKDTQPLLGASFAIAVASVLLAVLTTLALTGKLVSAYAVALTVFLCCWVIGFIIKDIKDKTRHAKHFFIGIKKLRGHYWAMQLAHVGVLISCLGVALSSHLSIEKDVALTVGDAVHVSQNGHSYTFQLADIQQKTAKNYNITQGVVDVYHTKLAQNLQNKSATNNINLYGEKITTLYPQKRLYVVSNRPMTEAAIDANLWRDLYVALGEPLDKNDITQGWAMRVYYKPFVRWIWLGAILMAIAGFLAMLDKRYRQY